MLWTAPKCIRKITEHLSRQDLGFSILRRFKLGYAGYSRASREARVWLFGQSDQVRLN